MKGAGLILLLSVFSLACGVSSEVKKNSMIQTSDMKVRNLDFYSDSHHLENGFTNIWGENEDPPFFSSAKWIAGRAFASPEGEPAAFRKIPPSEMQRPVKDYRIYWLSHATTLIQLPGVNVLTDPVFSERVSPVSFAGPARLIDKPASIDELPAVDIVIISHNHYDHTDLDSLNELKDKRDPLFIVPLKMKTQLLNLGITRVIELDWWQQVDTGQLVITGTPAKHFSGRGPGDRDETLWSGFYLQHKEGRTFFFAGDTGYSPHFKEIREKMGAPDVAVIPIGAYLPRWFMKRVHVNPEEAVQAFIDLEAAEMLAIHWGTFHLSDEPLDEPPRLTRQAAVEKKIDLKRIHILPAGGSFPD